MLRAEPGTQQHHAALTSPAEPASNPMMGGPCARQGQASLRSGLQHLDRRRPTLPASGDCTGGPSTPRWQEGDALRFAEVPLDALRDAADRGSDRGGDRRTRWFGAQSTSPRYGWGCTKFRCGRACHAPRTDAFPTGYHPLQPRRFVARGQELLRLIRPTSGSTRTYLTRSDR